jgi:hypothetical protein
MHWIGANAGLINRPVNDQAYGFVSDATQAITGAIACLIVSPSM